MCLSLPASPAVKRQLSIPSYTQTKVLFICSIQGNSELQMHAVNFQNLKRSPSISTGKRLG